MKDICAFLIYIVLLDGCTSGQEIGMERRWDLSRWRHDIFERQRSLFSYDDILGYC